MFFYEDTGQEACLKNNQAQIFLEKLCHPKDLEKKSVWAMIPFCTLENWFVIRGPVFSLRKYAFRSVILSAIRIGKANPAHSRIPPLYILNDRSLNDLTIELLMKNNRTLWWWWHKCVSLMQTVQRMHFILFVWSLCLLLCLSTWFKILSSIRSLHYHPILGLRSDVNVAVTSSEM